MSRVVSELIKLDRSRWAEIGSGDARMRASLAVRLQMRRVWRRRRYLFYRREQKDVAAKADKMSAIVRSGMQPRLYAHLAGHYIMRALFPETIVTLLSLFPLALFLVGLLLRIISMPSLASAPFFSRYRLPDVLVFCVQFS